jgi:hypothetical protein
MALPEKVVMNAGRKPIVKATGQRETANEGRGGDYQRESALLYLRVG